MLSCRTWHENPENWKTAETPFQIKEIKNISSTTPFECNLCNKSNIKLPFPPSSFTDLYCCVFRSRHHDTEDWVEDDTGDWTAVATQRVPFWWAWDPLFGVTLLTNGPTQGDLLFSFIQFGFKFHHLPRVYRYHLQLQCTYRKWDI